MTLRTFLKTTALLSVAPFAAIGAEPVKPMLTVRGIVLPPITDAVFNPKTGRNEINVELPFTVTKADIVSNVPYRGSYEYDPECVGLCELIVVIVIIIVAGVIYTYLLRTCKRWLPPTTNS